MMKGEINNPILGQNVRSGYHESVRGARVEGMWWFEAEGGSGLERGGGGGGLLVAGGKAQGVGKTETHRQTNNTVYIHTRTHTVLQARSS